LPSGGGSATEDLVVAIWILLAHSGDVSDLDRLLDLQGGWYLGEHEPCFLGVADCELCFLGWDWARGNVDFRDSVLVPAELANEHQPCSGSDDDFRCYLCSDLSRDSRRAGLVGVLVIALSEFESLDVATIP